MRRVAVRMLLGAVIAFAPLNVTHVAHATSEPEECRPPGPDPSPTHGDPPASSATPAVFLTSNPPGPSPISEREAVLYRLGPADGTLSARVESFEISGIEFAAEDGVHFEAASETLEWADGESGPKVMAIPILDHDPDAPALIFGVAFQGSDPDVGLISDDQFEMLIPGTCAAAVEPGALLLEQAPIEPGATFSTVDVVVTRSGTADGPALAGLDTFDIDVGAEFGVAGTHYTPVSASLEWDDGELGPKTLSIPILLQDTGPLEFGVAINELEPDTLEFANDDQIDLVIPGSDTNVLGDSIAPTTTPPPPTTTLPDPVAELPETGSNNRHLGAIALLLVGLGGALVASTRRRSPVSSEATTSR